MTTAAKNRPEYPMFKLYDLSFLARETGYSWRTLDDVRKGTKRPSKKLMFHCAGHLGKSIEELFGPSG